MNCGACCVYLLGFGDLVAVPRWFGTFLASWAGWVCCSVGWDSLGFVLIDC